MKTPLLLLLLFFSLIQTTKAQPGALDLSFNPHHGAGGSGAFTSIQAIAIQADGKILAGGDFHTFDDLPANYIVRLHSSGMYDTTFNTGTGANGLVRAFIVQPDSKIIVGGDFNSYNSDSAKFIMRLHANGTVDTSFHTGTCLNGPVYSLAMQPDGKIIAGGLFTAFNGITYNHLIRLLSDGTPDTSFNTTIGANGSVEAIAIQPDDKIVIGGDFTYYWGDPCLRVARVNTNGSRDSSFTALPGASAVVFDLALLPDGKIIIGGNFSQYDAQARSKIARLQTNGALYPQFGNQAADSEVRDIEVLSNGTALVAGGFTSFQNNTVNRLALVDTFFLLDTTFQSGANGSIWAMAIQPDKKIIIGGDFDGYGVNYRPKIARIYNCLTPQPDSIYGNGNALCNGTAQTYSVTPVNGATKYEWTLPSGWLGSSDSASITATGSGTGGTISVKAFTDSCGYSYSTTRAIATIAPPGVDICLVTVDSASTHNIIMWEKPITRLIDSFFIYRETTTNTYTKIAALPYDSLSEYHDTTANPNTTSYRYKLSVLDTCGAESALSPYHATIHFQNLGLGNFQWTFYRIENALNPVLAFNVYRDNLGNGNYFPIGNVPGTNSTYTDLTFNSFSNSVYVVDVDWGISCTPTRQVNTTRSNKRPKGMIDIIDTTTPSAIKTEIITGFELFPNPAGEIINLAIPASANVLHLALNNSLGQTVWSEAPAPGTTLKQISVNTLPKGVYSLNIETGMGRVVKKVVVE